MIVKMWNLNDSSTSGLLLTAKAARPRNASFWENVVSFWGLCPDLHHSWPWTLPGTSVLQTPLIAHPREKPCECPRRGATCNNVYLKLGVLCYTDDNRHFEDRHWVLRMERFRCHTDRAEVLGKSQTDVGRVSFMPTLESNSTEAVSTLLANVPWNRSAWVQTVEGVGQLFLHVSVEKNSRPKVLRLFQRLLFER